MLKNVIIVIIMNDKNFKIKKLIIKNDSVLGNLELDFQLANNSIAKTIIFLGDNGIGKSRLLRYLIFDLDYIEKEKNSNSPALQLSYVIEENDLDKNIKFRNLLLKLKSKNENLENFANSIKVKEYRLDYYGNNEFFEIFELESEDLNYFEEKANHFSKYGNILYCSFIQHYTHDYNKNMYQVIENIYKNSEKETMEYLSENSNKKINYKQILSNWKKFINSFNNIFEINHLSIKGWNKKENKLIFEKFGKEFSLENASFGEKQIMTIFSWILDVNKNSNYRKIIAFDELESYLHPKWQSNILYEINNLTNAQIFVSTHSPFIQNNINKENDLVFVLRRNDNGKILAKNNIYYGDSEIKKLEFLNIESEEINIVVSGVLDKFYIDQILYLWEDEFKNKNVFVHSPYKNSLNDSCGDDQQLSLHISWLDIMKDNPSYKIIFLYDFDFDFEEKFKNHKRKPKDSELENLFYKTSKKFDNKNIFNNILKENNIMGIENFLDLDNDKLNLESKINELKNQKVLKKREIKKHIKDEIIDLDESQKKKILLKIKNEVLKIIKNL